MTRRDLLHAASSLLIIGLAVAIPVTRHALRTPPRDPCVVVGMGVLPSADLVRAEGDRPQIRGSHTYATIDCGGTIFHARSDVGLP